MIRSSFLSPKQTPPHLSKLSKKKRPASTSTTCTLGKLLGCPPRAPPGSSSSGGRSLSATRNATSSGGASVGAAAAAAGQMGVSLKGLLRCRLPRAAAVSRGQRDAKRQSFKKTSSKSTRQGNEKKIKVMVDGPFFSKLRIWSAVYPRLGARRRRVHQGAVVWGV